MCRLASCFLLSLVLLVIGCDRDSESGDQAQAVNIYAAASTAHVLEPLAAQYEKQTHQTVRCNAAASSTLALQIEQGAPADIYLSANQRWMDHLLQAGLINEQTKTDLLANQIVLIGYAGEELANNPPQDVDIVKQLSSYEGKLAMGDPDHVPAGMYAKSALQSLGLWSAVESKIIPAKDVRSALLLVERGETQLGIVYKTDAVSSDRVVILATFPDESHKPIRYPIALTTTANSHAQAFMDYLKTEASRSAFEAAGFRFLGGSDDVH